MSNIQPFPRRFDDDDCTCGNSSYYEVLDRRYDDEFRNNDDEVIRKIFQPKIKICAVCGRPKDAGSAIHYSRNNMWNI